MRAQGPSADLHSDGRGKSGDGKGQCQGMLKASCILLTAEAADVLAITNSRLCQYRSVCPRQKNGLSCHGINDTAMSQSYEALPFAQWVSCFLRMPKCLCQVLSRLKII